MSCVSCVIVEMLQNADLEDAHLKGTTLQGTILEKRRPQEEQQQ